jgi:cyclase
MRNLRVIARLDVKMGKLIKGVQMEGWRKVGDPAEFAERYAEAGCDELIFMDVVASLYGRNTLVDTLKETASRVFVPMTVGGGVRQLEDAETLLKCGADKVAINTAATQNPDLVNAMSETFGAQATVISIEAVRQGSDWHVMTDNGRNKTGLSAVAWAKEVEDRGAGEIVLTAIHTEGMGKGLDLDLVRAVSEAVRIPVIAGGGLGDPDHLSALIRGTQASGVSVAQALHWGRVSMEDLRDVLRAEGCSVRDLVEGPA